MEDEDDVVVGGPEGEQPQHGDAALAGQPAVVEEAAQECVEALREDPRALALDDPLLHLAQPVLLVRVQHRHDRPHEVLEVARMLGALLHLVIIQYKDVSKKHFM